MTRRRLTRVAIFAAAILVAMAAGVAFEFNRGLADRTASTAELEQFRAVIAAFFGDVAARRGTPAAARVTGAVLEIYGQSRDLALHGSLEEIDHHPGESDPTVAFKLRVLFTAAELERMSGKEVFAALIDKGEIITLEGAAAWARAPLVRAELDRGAATRVHVADAQGREIALEQQANGAWLLDRVAIGILAWDSWYRLTPACAAPEVDAARCAAEQQQREALLERWRHDPNPAAIGSRPWLERTYGPLFFAAFVHHPFDPKYLNPLR